MSLNFHSNEYIKANRLKIDMDSNTRSKWKSSILFIYILVAFVLILPQHGNCSSNPKDNLKIGVVLPVEHRSLNKIVQGIHEVLDQQEIIVKNAHGDLALQQQIIKQLAAKVDILIPVGLSATKMTLAATQTKPVIGAAADGKKIQYQGANLVWVNDEISASEYLKIIRLIFPKLSKFVFVFSPTEKTDPDLMNRSIRISDDMPMNVGYAMVRNMTELTTSIYPFLYDAEAFLVSKDHLIVSSIKTLNRKISKTEALVIASDEGSVYEGAHCAIGIDEKSIGNAVGNIAKKIMNGEKTLDLTPQDLSTKWKLFINSDFKDRIKYVADMGAIPRNRIVVLHDTNSE